MIDVEMPPVYLDLSLIFLRLRFKRRIRFLRHLARIIESLEKRENGFPLVLSKMGTNQDTGDIENKVITKKKKKIGKMKKIQRENEQRASEQTQQEESKKNVWSCGCVFPFQHCRL